MKWREGALTQEGAAWAALVTVYEDASGVNEQRILRDVARVFAGAEALVCLRLQKMGCA